MTDSSSSASGQRENQPLTASQQADVAEKLGRALLLFGLATFAIALVTGAVWLFGDGVGSLAVLSIGFFVFAIGLVVAANMQFKKATEASRSARAGREEREVRQRNSGDS